MIEGRLDVGLGVTFDFPRISLFKSCILSSSGKDLNFCKDFVDYRTIGASLHLFMSNDFLTKLTLIT